MWHVQAVVSFLFAVVVIGWSFERHGLFSWKLTFADVYSIREFCKMDMPVIMFDVNQDYVVATLEQVSLF